MKAVLKSFLINNFPPFCQYLNWRDRRNALKPIDENYQFEPETKLLLNMIPHNQAMLDVGANWGAWSCIMGSILPTEMIYSFEPISEPFNILQKRKKNNVFNVAVSAESGTCTLKIPKIKGKLSTYRSSVNHGYTYKDEDGCEYSEAQKITIDEFVENNIKIVIGFIKIDVEGHELEVLKGAKKTITENHPIMLIEIEQKHYDISIKDVLKKISSFGYNIYFFKKPDLALRPISEFSAEKNQDPINYETNQYVNNFIFLPK